MDKFKSIFGEMTPERKAAIEESRVEREERLQRKQASLWHFRIPSNTDGCIEFWYNNNKDKAYFESEDTRLTDSKVRDIIQLFAHNLFDNFPFIK